MPLCAEQPVAYSPTVADDHFFIGMQIYMVGGAVRDTLLHRPIKEKDWVVVGATHEDCLKRGWRAVANQMPVYIDPTSKQEYALARKEHKTGIGYRGFTFECTPEISLAEDLLRRDLTINALAMDEHGQLIDPHHFARDIEEKQLRHISDSFIEDPLRVIRLASLYARLYSSGFRISPTTIALIKKMTTHENAQAEFSSLAPVQLWAQLEKSFQSVDPQGFIEVLVDTDVATHLLPEPLHSQESIELLRLSGQQLSDPQERFAIWVHQLNPEEKESFLKRLEVPKAYRTYSEELVRLLPFYQVCLDKPIPSILEIFYDLNAFADPERFYSLTLCCKLIVDFLNRDRFIPQPQKLFLDTMLSCAAQINRKRILRRNIDGTPQMAEEIDKHRCAQMARVHRYYPWSDLSVAKMKIKKSETENKQGGA